MPSIWFLALHRKTENHLKINSLYQASRPLLALARNMLAGMTSFAAIEA